MPSLSSFCSQAFEDSCNESFITCTALISLCILKTGFLLRILPLCFSRASLQSCPLGKASVKPIRERFGFHCSHVTCLADLFVHLLTQVTVTLQLPQIERRKEKPKGFICKASTSELNKTMFKPEELISSRSLFQTSEKSREYSKGRAMSAEL